MVVSHSTSITPICSVENRSTATESGSENLLLAGLLHEIATLLADQGASAYRIAAYQHASEMLKRFTTPIRDIFEWNGIPGLIALPTIGRSIAHRIEEYLQSGHIPLLDRLRGDETAERVFATLPGVGDKLSQRLHEQLGIESLPELLEAIDEGRLEQVAGMGRKRVRTIREVLLERLRHTEPRLAADPLSATVADTRNPPSTVSVSEILDVDAEYRRLASAGKLPKIAPTRLNPDHDRWLPILHTQRGDRHYTAMYSNSRRAHELNTIHDWVVIYRDDPQAEGRWTAITSRFGHLRGYRIVRGREYECEELYLPPHSQDGCEDPAP